MLFPIFISVSCFPENPSEANAPHLCLRQDGYHVPVGVPLAALVQGQPDDEEMWAAGTPCPTSRQRQRQRQCLTVLDVGPRPQSAVISWFMHFRALHEPDAAGYGT